MGPRKSRVNGDILVELAIPPDVVRIPLHIVSTSLGGELKQSYQQKRGWTLHSLLTYCSSLRYE